MATREHKLVNAFVELSDALVEGHDVPDLMYTLVERCVEVFGVAGAGLMLADEEGGLRVVAHFGPKAGFIELLESQVEEGPCFDAYQTGELVVSADIEAETDRWPRVSAELLRAGYRAAHGVPLRVRDKVIGAMNLFGLEPGELDEADQEAVRALAEFATLALLHGRALSDARMVTEQLQSALDSRVVIEQAKGIIAASSGLHVQDAFELLRRHARNHGLRLDDVARQVIAGTLDPSALSR